LLAVVAAAGAGAERREVQFRGFLRKTPQTGKVNSASLGIVEIVRADGSRDVVVELPCDVGKVWTREARAKEIAKRMNLLVTTDPNWPAKLKADKTYRGRTPLSVVVADVRAANIPMIASGALVITADSPSAREWGMSTGALAGQIVQDIKNGVSGRADPPTPHMAAVMKKQEADAAYHAGRFEEAEKLYRAAIAYDESYAIPYLRLAGLLRERGGSSFEAAKLQQAGKAIEATRSEP
jgi:tetratricopeptide (TPR) repeat protein